MIDTETRLEKSFQRWLKRQPQKDFIIVTANDPDDRQEMQGLREAFGFTGTAYFSTLEGYH